MNKDAIYHNFLLFCCLIEVARQWWFLIFVRRVFVSKISSNSIAFKWLTPTLVRTNFFNQIYHILASFASYCPLSTRPNIVAHTSSSTSSLTFSSISWAWRHTSWCVAFSCSTAKGTASQLWSTFHILCQNQKEVGCNHEGKTAHFVLVVKGSNGGQTCTLW